MQVVSFDHGQNPILGRGRIGDWICGGIGSGRGLRGGWLITERGLDSIIEASGDDVVDPLVGDAVGGVELGDLLGAVGEV